MKTTPLLILIASVIPAAVQAEPETTTKYVLKNRSVFAADMNSRIPFWPIGFVRPPKGTVFSASAAPVAKFRLEPEHFSVTSILLGNPPLATINGRSFGEGELLPVIRGTERLRVVLRAVRDGGVVIEHDGQEITVPMRRVELGARQVQRQAEAAEFVIQVGGGTGK